MTIWSLELQGRSISRLILLRFTLVPLLLSLFGCASKSTPEPILIGHLAPFRGPEKALAEHAKQAILLAVEETNKEDNRFGGRKIAVLHPEYSTDDPETVKYTAVRLVTVDRVVGLLAGRNAAEANRLSRTVKDHDVPVLTPAAITPDFSDENLFSVNASVQVKREILARFAAEGLKAQRVGLLVDSRLATGSVRADAFEKEFAEKHGRQTVRRTFKSENDFGDLAEQVKKAQVAAALFIGPAEAAGKLAAKFKDAGVPVTLLLDGDEEHLAKVASEQQSNTIYWATVYAPGASTPRNQEFAKKYKDRFHEDPDIVAALSYDGLRVLVEAIRRADSVKSAKILEALSEGSRSFDCLTGSLTFEKDHTARRPLFIVSIKDGRPAIVKQY
jgi:branched-chain amino acid transport system substrate-binding protein